MSEVEGVGITLPVYRSTSAAKNLDLFLEGMRMRTCKSWRLFEVNNCHEFDFAGAFVS